MQISRDENAEGDEDKKVLLSHAHFVRFNNQRPQPSLGITIDVLETTPANVFDLVLFVFNKNHQLHFYSVVVLPSSSITLALIQRFPFSFIMSRIHHPSIEGNFPSYFVIFVDLRSHLFVDQRTTRTFVEMATAVQSSKFRLALHPFNDFTGFL